MTCELVAAGFFVALLLGLAGYFGRRQWQTLRGLRGRNELSTEDRRYYLVQAWRRLFSCLLMTAFAGILAGWYLFGLDRRAVELGEHGKADAAAQAMLNAEQQQFFHLASLYWICAVLILFVLVYLALVDLWAIRRFGLRHFRQIQSERNEMLEQEITVLRTQRNGHP